MSKLLYKSDVRHATWLELFFDLIFVVGLGKLTHLLAHVHHGHLDKSTWPHFFLGFITLWWIWIGHTLYNNRFDTDSRTHRVTTLALMFCILLAAIQLSGPVTENQTVFIMAYLAARLLIATLYYISSRLHPENAGFAKTTAKIYTTGALISASAVFFPFRYAVLIFFLGIIAEIIALLVLRRGSIPVDREHLIERVGLLAIILLGESVISISNSMQGISWDTYSITTSLLGFIFICMIWWIYFDSFPLLIESDQDPNGNAILFSQLGTYLGFSVLANMTQHAILRDLDMPEFRIMVATGVVLFYLGKQTAYYVNRPEYRPYIWLNTTVMGVICGIALTLPSSLTVLGVVVLSMALYIAMNAVAMRRLYGRLSELK